MGNYKILMIGVLIAFIITSTIAIIIYPYNDNRDITQISTQTKINSSTTSANNTSIVNKNEKIDERILEYFIEVGLGSEYGEGRIITHKWVNDVIISLDGYPTTSDLNCLNNVIEDLSLLISEIKILISEGDGNVKINFVPEKEFKNYLDNYIPINYGFFSINWNEHFEIEKATILISITNITEVERCHLIREELTQSLGLMQDSFKYPDSIFYQNWTNTNQYSEIDKEIINLLYSPNIISGMSREEILKVFPNAP